MISGYTKRVRTATKILFLFMAFVASSNMVWAGQLTAFNYNTSDKQERKVTVEFNNDHLSDALHTLADKVNVGISYDTKVVPSKSVTYRANNTSVYTVLNAILSGTGLYATLSDNRRVILIKKRNIEEPVQTGSITGTVIDAETREPLPGANVYVEATRQGASTNVQGKFEISGVEAGTYNITATYIGYQKLQNQVTVRDDEVVAVDFELQARSKELDEVVVVAYGEQSETSFTGSAEEIDIAKVEESPRVSFQESLQGNVAGVQSVASSGQPGAKPDVRIRGIGSINASSDPLYVVDGIPVVSDEITQLAEESNTIAGLNPNDIESITVLKDASATAIYGSRGANGVVLITTKQGSGGRTNFNVNIQHGISEALIDDRNKPLNTDELSELLVESRMNIGDTKAEAEDYIFSRIDESIDTDWHDVITQQGTYKQYFVSTSGGNEKTSFYSSVGYYDQQPAIIGIDYEKVNGKVDVKHNATDKLILGVGVTANTQVLNTNSDGGSANNPVRAMFREVPWEPVYNEDGSYNTDILLTYNPIGLVEENTRETKLYNVLGSLSLEYNILSNLSFRSQGNLDFNYADEFQYDNPYFGAGRNDGGRGRSYEKKVINWNITNLLKYQWDINENQNLDFTLGQEAQKITINSTYAYASNYGAPGLQTLANASTYNNASSEVTASTISSYFLSMNYDFGEKYYVNVTGRRDGSSRFGSNVRYANFGSVGVGWNINEEDFFPEESFVNQLKLRSSYGINGNQGISNFESRGLYSTGADYNGSPGYAYSQQANPELTWEKNKPFNVGLDFEVFDRISGSVDYYNRVTSDLLLNVPISGVNGILSYLANIGEMKNRGWEISLHTLNIARDNDLFWSTDFNITTNNNEIVKLNNDEPIIDNRYIRSVGEDFYTYYLPGYAGVDPDNGEALWYTDGTESETTNNYGEAEPYMQGSGLPDFYAGLTNTINYKNVGLSFLVYLNWGNKVYDYWGRYLHSDGSARLNDRGNMSRQLYERRWQQPGDQTDMPKIVWGNTQSGLSNQHSTRFLHDGTYLRLREVTLTYNLPTSILEKLRIRGAKIYLKGNNLLTWVRDKDLESDPEVGISGSTDLKIPTSRQYLLGIDFSF